VNAVCTFGFYKMLGNYRVATQLVGPGGVLSSIEFVCLFVCLLVSQSFSMIHEC
jgi:hypothetical protein